MAVTLQRVRALLDVDEPDYTEAAKLGADALPHLEKLVQAGDPMLASKAVYLASLIGGDASVDIVAAGAASHDPRVRVAAAAALRNMPEGRVRELARTLLADPDAGVRRTTRKSAPPSLQAELGVVHEEELSLVRAMAAMTGGHGYIPVSREAGVATGHGGDGTTLMMIAERETPPAMGDGGGSIDSGTVKPAVPSFPGEGGGSVG